MINCKECGYRLSDKAKACPNCGAPIEVANPPKKKPVKKKWWERDCNGWKFGTLIASFLFVIFFIAFLTKINTSSFERYDKSVVTKRNGKSEANLSFSSKPPSLLGLFKKDLNYKEIKILEKKHKKMISYFEELKKGELSYRKVLKACNFIDDYAKELKRAKEMKIVFDNNRSIDELIEKQKRFQKAVFPKLRIFYNKVVKMKFFAILRSAVGGKRKNKIIFEATIFANEREIDKFHKIILNDLKKLRFKEVIYILEKRIKIRGVSRVEERKGLIYEIDSLFDWQLL